MGKGNRVIGFHGTARLDHTQRAMMGAMRYVEDHKAITLRDFRMADTTTSESQFAPPWRGDCDGVIVHMGRGPDMTDRDVGDWVTGGGVPAVSIAEDWSDRRVPQVVTDIDVVVNQAADHLIDAGCRSIMFFGFAHSSGSAQRAKLFRQAIKGRCENFTEHVLEHRLHGGWEDLATVQRDETLVQRMRDLPRPLGVWALNDNFAHAIYLLCESLGLNIPQQVRVLGSGDWAIARTLSPTLSSIRMPHEEMGYQAARALHRIMTGQRLARKRLALRSAELIVRPSTATGSNLPGDVREALAYIERHGCEGVTVDQIADAVGLPSRTFVRHFRKAVGHSVGDEVTRVRLERAKALLRQQALSVSRIAAMVGFEETAAFSKFFTKQIGQSPRAYRKSLK